MLDAFAKRVEEELQKLPINDVASLERAAAAAKSIAEARKASADGEKALSDATLAKSLAL